MEKLAASESVLKQASNRKIGFAHCGIVSPSYCSDSYQDCIILENNRILELGVYENLKNYKDVHWYDASGFLISPGLVDAHSHLALNYLKGLAHSQTNVVHDLNFPTEKHLNAELTETLATSSILAGLQSGVTCFVDHYYKIEGSARALDQFGVRGVVGETLMDLSGPFKGKSIIADFLELVDNWPFSSRITAFMAPHASDTCSEAYLKEMATTAKQRKMAIHFHLAQTPQELQQAKSSGRTPVKIAKDTGLLGEHSLATHLLYLGEDDIEILKDSGTYAGFCPSSQALFDHVAAVQRFFDSDIPICLGSDCASTNDQADLINEMKIGHLFAKEQFKTGAYTKEIGAADVLLWATQNPAKLFDLKVGDLAEGFLADLLFFEKDLATGSFKPDALNLIYSFSSRKLKHVMVDGRWVLWNQKSTLVDENEYLPKYEAAVQQMLSKANL